MEFAFSNIRHFEEELVFWINSNVLLLASHKYTAYCYKYIFLYCQSIQYYMSRWIIDTAISLLPSFQFKEALKYQYQPAYMDEAIPY